MNEIKIICEGVKQHKNNGFVGLLPSFIIDIVVECGGLNA